MLANEDGKVVRATNIKQGQYLESCLVFLELLAEGQSSLVTDPRKDNIHSNAIWVRNRNGSSEGKNLIFYESRGNIMRKDDVVKGGQAGRVG